LEEDIKLLILLQDLDGRMGHILAQKAEGPKKIQRLEKRLMDVEAQLAEETDQMDAFSRERREVDQNIDDAESKLKKANLKLSNIKSNKEYQAALKEIEDLKKAKFLLEDRAIEMMERFEKLETKCAVSRQEATEVKKQYKLDRQALSRSMEALDRDLSTLQKDRQGISQAVDRGLLKRYDTLRGRKGGIAVSSVVEGVCQTCHLRIPPQEFNELIRGDKLMTCPNCMRIIYWGEDERFNRASSENNSE